MEGDKQMQPILEEHTILKETFPAHTRCMFSRSRWTKPLTNISSAEMFQVMVWGRELMIAVVAI